MYRENFFKKNTQTALVEVCEFFDQRKVRIGFRKYDTKEVAGSRVTASIDIFMSVEEAKVLSGFILEGWAEKMLEAKPKSIFDSQIGGYDKGGKTRYRKMSIFPGTKAEYAISAIEGDGKRDGNGLIQAVAKADTMIMMPFSAAELKYFAVALNEAVRSFDFVNYQYGRANKVSTQFVKFNAKEALVEVCEAFDLDKVKIGFIKYDTSAAKGSRVSASIDFYMSIEDASVFALDIISGKMAKAQKACTNVNNPIWESKIGGKGTGDNVRYRKMSLYAGTKAEYAIGAAEGDGKRDTKGLIQPVKKADTKVFIPLTKRDVRMLGDALQRAVESYHLQKTIAWKK